MGGLKAIDSEHATSREKIVRKAKTGDPESKHNRESFKRLKDLGLIDAAQRIGTWLTEGGLSLLENKYR
jgi:ribosomal protein S19E (S16A)